MTDAPWPLPPAWKWARFGDIAYVASRLTDPAKYPDLPHIAPNHIESDTGKLLPYATVAEDGVTSAKHLFEAGDVLYSKIRPYLAKVAMAPVRGLCSADMYPIRTAAVLEPAFLRWWMLTNEFTRRAAGQQARTVLPKINKRSLYELPVPVPPVPVQRHIVEVLDDHLSRLDAGVAGLRAGKRRVLAYQQGSLEALLETPESDRVALGSLIERVEAGKSFGGSAPPAIDNGWGVIKVSAMTWGEFRPEENKAVPAEHADPRFEIVPGDVLISRANTTAYVGAPVLVRETPPRRLLSDKSLRLVPRADVDPEWLVAVLSAPGTRRQISAVATGTSDSMRNISQQNLLNVHVPRTPPAEQGAIIQRFSSVRTTVRRMEVELERGVGRSQSLRRALLDAAFSGRLTGRPSELGRIEELVGAIA